MSDDLHRSIAVVASDHVYQIRKLHRQFHPTTNRLPDGARCVECSKVWPCPTIQILDRRLT